ncbi:MAG: hypothetical protein Alpg2KO_02120 [Alphaproteobacteria bacterium]
MDFADSLMDLTEKMMLLVPLSLLLGGVSQLLKSARSPWALGIRLRWLAASLKLPARHDISLPDGQQNADGQPNAVGVDHIFALPDRLVVITMSDLEGRITNHDANAPSWEVQQGRGRKLVDNPLRPMERAMLAVNWVTEGGVDRNGRVVTRAALRFDGTPPPSVMHYPVFKAEMRSLLQTVSQDDQIALGWDKLTEASGPPLEKPKGPPLSFWIGWTMLALCAFSTLWLATDSFVANLPNQ